MKKIDTSRRIKIAMADDHALFRQGVRTALSVRRDIEVIAEADNGLQLLKLLEYVQPDVILLDIQMPVMDGITTLPEIRKLYPDVKVIILSMHNDHSMISKLMEMGANSYLTKNSDSESIYQAIKTCFEQEFFFNELTNKALLSGLRTKKVEHSPDDVELSEKEVRILKLMCEEKTTKEIADIEDISPRTVEAIRDKLKTKTGVKSMAGLVMFAVKIGILEEGDSEVQQDPISRIKEKGNKITDLTKEQMTGLFSLSTSILAYINHDLAGQRNTIDHTLNLIKGEIEQRNEKQFRGGVYTKAIELVQKALDATATIGSITSVIKSHSHLHNQDDTTDFDNLFISRPVEVISIIRQRYKDVQVDVSEDSLTSLEIIYPPKILLAVLSELTENAKRASQFDLKVLIKWEMNGHIFKCEVHDNGPGFTGLSDKKYVPIGSLMPSADAKAGGLGLSIINRTILDSSGLLFFSHSEILSGAKVYFQFPVIEFTSNKDINKKGKKVYDLSKEQMAKLFSLSTAILAYINHDLAGQRNLIFYALNMIQGELNSKNNKQSSIVNNKLNNLVKKALAATATISSITNVIKSHFYLNNQGNTTDLDKLFISRPAEIINIIRQRYTDIKIEINSTTPQFLQIVYPPKILLAILSELTENAKKMAKSDLNILISWKMNGDIFQCEFHDNGPGFSSLKSNKYIPIDSLTADVDGKLFGIGLSIINRTILDSGGHLYFRNSELLNGASVYFEFPVINFEKKNE